MTALGIAALFMAQISTPLWHLESADDTVRWLEIHNLKTAQADGLYHVEIMQRRATDPVWEFQALAAHMAVTEAALRASIITPMKRAFAHPESFDDGYRAWQQARMQNHAFICTTNVNSCLKQLSP